MGKIKFYIFRKTKKITLHKIADKERRIKEKENNNKINDLAEKIFKLTQGQKFHNPYYSAMYRISLDTIDEKLGNKKWKPSTVEISQGEYTPEERQHGRKIIGVQNKKTCLLGSKIPQNDKSPINIHLIIGSLLFGAGWGLVGLCPGPAIASITFGGKEGYIFVISMLIGMSLKDFLIKEKNTIFPKYN